jgi:hypothetical protein
MEAVSASETSVYFQETTRRYIPDSYRIHICRHENPKFRYFSLYVHWIVGWVDSLLEYLNLIIILFIIKWSVI